MRAEDGIGTVIKLMEKFIDEKVKTGKWADDFRERWVNQIGRPTPLPAGKFKFYESDA